MKKILVILSMAAMTAMGQAIVKNPLCYGEPIQLSCNYSAGCANEFATYHWENFSGSWTSSERDPTIYPGQDGYIPSGMDKYYISIQFGPPPGGFLGGRVVVTMYPAMTITSSVTAITCGSGDNGAIDITVTGGNAPYGYLWSNGVTTQDLSNLAAGTYSVTVTSNGNVTHCTKTASYTIIPSMLPLGFVQHNTFCSRNNGAITVTPACPQTYDYLWSDGSTTQTIVGCPSGAYSVTVTDPSFNTATSSTVIL